MIKKTILLYCFVILAHVRGQRIDCNGKGFYCQNSTHFHICVDMGGGLTTTIDNAVVPCPPDTACSNSQLFECAEVIGIGEAPSLGMQLAAASAIGSPPQLDIAARPSVISNIQTAINPGSVGNSSESDLIAPAGSNISLATHIPFDVTQTPNLNQTTVAANATEHGITAGNGSFLTVSPLPMTTLTVPNIEQTITKSADLLPPALAALAALPALPALALNGPAETSDASAASPMTTLNNAINNITSAQALYNFTINEISPEGALIQRHTIQVRTIQTTENYPINNFVWRPQGTTESWTPPPSPTTSPPATSSSGPAGWAAQGPSHPPEGTACQRPGQYPDENDCRAFFMCFDNVRYKLICPYNMVYSPSLQKCTPLKEHCVNNKAVVCNRIGRIPDEKSCYSYYECRPNGPGFAAARLHCPWYSSYQPSAGQCVSDSGCRRAPQRAPQRVSLAIPSEDGTSVNIFYPDSADGLLGGNVDFNVGYGSSPVENVEIIGRPVVEPQWSQPDAGQTTSKWVPSFFGTWFNVP